MMDATSVMAGDSERRGGRPGSEVQRLGEQGFALVGLVVAIFLILLVLGVAAPKVAQELRREREVEAVNRGNQYVRAIQLYYRKFGTYPGSMEMLEKSNNIRFLRQKYLDPMTGKADWRIIKVGEAKTTVKGFFGQPLAGIGGAPGGLGSAAGMASPGGTGTPAGGTSSAFGGSSAFGSGSGSGSAFGTPGSSSGSAFGSSPGTAPGATPGTSPGLATPGGTDTSGAGSTPGATGGIGSQSATSFTGSGAPFVGVGLPATGDSIVVLNEQTSYPTWEFIYDPRIEQLKANASLFGGGPASAGGSGLGSASGMSSGLGGAPTGAAGAGSSPTSGFGSGFGSGSGTGTGSTPPPTSGPGVGTTPP